MRKVMAVIALLAMAFNASVGHCNDDEGDYDDEKTYNEENIRVFDKKGNYEGHIYKDRVFDSKGNYQGRITNSDKLFSPKGEYLGRAKKSGN